MKYISVLVTSELSQDFQKESGLGIVDYITVTEAVEASSQDQNANLHKLDEQRKIRYWKICS